ncbi:MAG: ketopantoate reductase family protein [Anaerolineales bacterium]
MKQRIAVLGVGGIGGSIGAYLTREGHDVTLIDQWAAHVEAIKEGGLTLSDVNGTFIVPVTALHLSEVSGLREPFDMVFLSVKSYDTVWSIHLIAPHLAPSGFVLPAMNALNDESVAQIVGYHRVVGCMTLISAGVYDPGHVVRTDPTTTHAFTVGELSGRITPRVEETVEMLQVIGPSKATTNLWGARWSKLVWNAMGNALAGLLGPEGQEMDAEQADLENLVRVVIGGEAATVATRMGIVLEPLNDLSFPEFAHASTRDDFLALRDKLAAARGGRGLTEEQLARLPEPGRPSLLQDVIKGRRTEVDYLNGVVVEKGGQLGVPTPMNEAVVDLMHRLEAGEIAPGLINLERLEERLPF